MTENLRLARIDVDGWELESGEARHAKHPATFWIPPREQRESLEAGHAAKLLFRIEMMAEGGTLERNVEKMWVIVVRRAPEGYVGILDNEPEGIEPDAALSPGTAVLFLPEHIVDIDNPPRDYLVEKYGDRLDI